PINHAHPATPDFFQNLIIAESPISVAQLNLTEYILQRFCVAAPAVLVYLLGGILRQPLREQAVEAKSAFDARSRPTLRTGIRFLSNGPWKGSAGGPHGKAIRLEWRANIRNTK